MSNLTRYFLKHRAEPATYAIETDEEGTILGALDVTDGATKGGLCAHMLDSMALTGRVDDIEYLNRTRDDFEPYEPNCANEHHLLSDLLALEKEYLTAMGAYAASDAETKTLKKSMEARGEKVHALLAKIADRKPLPLFDAAGV